MNADRHAVAAAVRGAAATLALLGLLAGVPAALTAAGGWPLPGQVPGWAAVREALEAPTTDAALLRALGLACWVLWAQFAVATAVETVALVRGRTAPRMPLAGPAQAAAGALLAAVTLSLLAVRAGAAAPRAPLAAAVTPNLEVATTIDASPTAVVDRPSRGVAASALRHVVGRGETLWSVAETCLGDPFRWPEIWRLNRGTSQPDGRSLTDPHWIYSGWVLSLPPDATVPTAGTPEPSVPARSEPSPNGDRSARQHRSGSGASARASPAPTTPQRQTEPPEEPPDAEPFPVSVDLPSGSVVGVTLAAGFAAGVALERLRRRRTRVPGPPAPGLRYREGASDPAALLEHLAQDRKGASTDELPPDPASIPLGWRDDGEVWVDALALGGVALLGDAAPDAARAIVASLLWRPHVRGELLLPAPAAERLGIGNHAALRIVPDLDTALDELELDLLRRARLLDSEGAEDIAAHHRDHPDDLLPLRLVVVTDDLGSAAARLQALIRLGRRVGIAALLVGAEVEDAAVIQLDGDQVATATPDYLHEAIAGARAFTLTASDWTALATRVANNEAEEAVPESPFDTPPAPASPAIAVQVFGDYRIVAGGEEVVDGLRSKAREVLAYFLVHPEGARLEVATDALWPQAEPGRGSEWFWTALGNLRSRLREATDCPELKVIDRHGETYRVEDGLLDIDLWRFEAALAAAQQTQGGDLVQSLEDAAAAYRGDLLPDTYYEWVDVPRTDLRRRAVDALVRLAELRDQSEDLEGALAALEQAVAADPYCEDLYRRMMSTQAAIGRPVRAAFSQLEARLAELDVEPEPETVTLFRRLASETPAIGEPVAEKAHSD